MNESGPVDLLLKLSELQVVCPEVLAYKLKMYVLNFFFYKYIMDATDPLGCFSRSTSDVSSINDSILPLFELSKRLLCLLLFTYICLLFRLP